MAYKETATIIKAIEIILELAPSKEEALKYIKDLRKELKKGLTTHPDK